MSLFHLVSCSSKALSIQFDGADPAEALRIARHAQLAEADLWQGGTYLFTLRRHGDLPGFWAIFRKSELCGGPQARTLN